jgi:hypothetical protein
MLINDTYLMLYLSIARELIDELNANSAAGLITQRALPLISVLDQHTRKIERMIRDAQSQPASQ